MKKTLVTGGCGFLGSAIVRALIGRGHEVRILAVPGEPTDNVSDLDVEVVRGDVRSPADCVAAVEGMHWVFHAAAIYKSYVPDPTSMYEVNLRGTFNMLEACRRAEVEQVIYTASIVALGRAPGGTMGDEDTKYDVWDLDFPYSRSKYHSRHIAEDFAAWGLDVRVVCPGIVFGPGDIAPTPSGKLIIDSVAGGPPLYMDGGAAYVDVRDAAEVHVLAAERGAAKERYVAVGHNLSNLEFMQAIGRAADRDRRYFKLPIGVVRRLVAAVGAAEEAAGREPSMPRTFFEYSLKPSFFSNTKSTSVLGASYRPIEQTIGDAIEYFRRVGRI